MTVERFIVGSIESEYERYKLLGEGAMRQLSDAELSHVPDAESNSVATIVWHIAGNLESRFTEFLTSDGEKPWRDREGEFAPRAASRADVQETWDRGWHVLLATLAGITDAHLTRPVRIRGQELRVLDALHRSLAHTSYHVGQMVYLAKSMRGAAWTSLSIPKGGSQAYNENPTRERRP
jgi:hypothetical protein